MARTSSSLFIPAFVFLSLLNAAFAANDWNKPCFEGACSYDFSSSPGRPSSGSLNIWGSPDAITDITTAAGWEILDCDQDAVSQDIRLVCTGDYDSCADLYKGAGAEGKVVRLPENCGPNPFAHISRAWVPRDQSIPETLVLGDGTQPEVQALHIDTDFESRQAGTVHFAFSGSKVPGGSLDDIYPSDISKRGLRSFFKKVKNTVQKGIEGIKDVATDVGDKIKDGVENVGDVVKDGFDKVKDVAENVGDKVKDTAENIGDKVKDAAETVVDKAKDVVDDVKDAAKDGADKVGDFFKTREVDDGTSGDALDHVHPSQKRGLRSFFKKVKNTVQKGVEGIKDAATDVGDKIKDGVENVGDAVKDGFDKVKDGVDTIGDKVKDAAETVGDKAKDVVDNIKDGAKDAADKVGDLADKIVN